MHLNPILPRKALNKAFLKLKPNRSQIEQFKANLTQLLDRINETESEEFHKNLVIDFLKKTYYEPNHFVNTKGRTDLVIHNGNNATSSVGVVIETKKPTNRNEMLAKEKINVKAFHELVLYYMRERISNKNLEIKYLIATNIYEWFVFDANIFEKHLAHSKSFVKQFNDFEGGRLAGKTTDFFYKEIAEPFIASIDHEIEFTHFDIRDYEKPLRNIDKADDAKLIALFKLLSCEHLLKLPFTNDSNSLDKRFYGELLHIIGLTETKDGGKKVIERSKEGQRNSGSLIENAITQLDSLDKIRRLDKPSQFGGNLQDQLFSVALELSITWINRILFLKLLEAQLITYHKGDRSFSFLNLDRIKNYDDLNSLFFQVLARRYEERDSELSAAFQKIPYLNSSLFEPTDLEHTTLFISNLRDEKPLPIYSATVLKDEQGKKRTGQFNALEYLFEFLNAYDFASEGSEEIQEDNKTLINASVLGLIFEKINGYKDGSFFTPGFITMYMCRETIRRAVVQKFNEVTQMGSGGVSKLTSMSGSVPRRTIIPYNPKLKELARNLRNNSTKSEIILWKQLKGKFEDKYDFHRQKPLDNYIADFFCHELKLVIEIDGETHNWEETQKKDFTKESRLNELGLNVLRFPDTEIFENLNGVVETIIQYVDGFEKGDLSGFKFDDTPLNPLTGVIIDNDTPLNPLSRGDFPTPGPTQKEGKKNRFNTLDDIYEEIGDDKLFTRAQANSIINSLKICDPAVGSGHFLVSALNEIIAIKNDLRILQDREGKRLKEYHVEVENDELIVTDEDGVIFEYNPKSHESQRVQETLFHEKQTIIENCLFGVDINPNSVKICRLRLWIELLKNAYYKNETELETLPNIDINIKCGNSLISRFALDADLGQALKRSKWNIDSYRLAVDTYRNAHSKEEKREMERLIADIKNDFRSEITQNDPKLKRLQKAKGELFSLTNQTTLFEKTKKEKEEWNKKVKKLTDEINRLEAEIEEIKNNKIYENSFEWRFEFPEVLNANGDFVGFDVVIGNPPYGVEFNELEKKFLKEFYSSIHIRTPESFNYFWGITSIVSKKEGFCNFIIPSSFLSQIEFEKTRKLILENFKLYIILNLGDEVFDDVATPTCIVGYEKQKSKTKSIYLDLTSIERSLLALSLVSINNFVDTSSFLLNDSFSFVYKNYRSILEKCYKHRILKDIAEDVATGVSSGLDKAYVYKNSEIDELLLEKSLLKKLIIGGEINRYSLNPISGKYLVYITNENNISDFPNTEKQLLQFKNQLIRRREAAKGIIEWYSLNWPRRRKLFENNKILIRQTANRIIAAYDNDGWYCLKSGLIVQLPDNSDLHYFYLLALLNSKLFDFLYHDLVNEDNRIFPEVKPIQLFKLPIKVADQIGQEPIVTLVKQIHLAKTNGLSTENLESQIDQLVYQLYGLTDEEIAIVEGSVK